MKDSGAREWRLKKRGGNGRPKKKIKVEKVVRAADAFKDQKLKKGELEPSRKREKERHSILFTDTSGICELKIDRVRG